MIAPLMPNVVAQGIPVAVETTPYTPINCSYHAFAKGIHYILPSMLAAPSFVFSSSICDIACVSDPSAQRFPYFFPWLSGCPAHEERERIDTHVAAAQA